MSAQRDQQTSRESATSAELRIVTNSFPFGGRVVRTALAIRAVLSTLGNLWFSVVAWQPRVGPAGCPAIEAGEAPAPVVAQARPQRALRPVIAGPWALSGQNCTVLLTDVVGFSSRSEKDCCIIRDALRDMTDMMLDGMTEVWTEGRGDGILTVLWPSIPTKTVVDRLTGTLLPALMAHNGTNRDSARFRMRAAIGVGPLVSDAMGPNGQAITTIARLVDAPLFKKAMNATDASLGLIATQFIYETVLAHDQDLPRYRQIHVDKKPFDGPAWMRFFNAPVPTQRDIHPAAA
jgi:hypothetical protein